MAFIEARNDLTSDQYQQFFQAMVGQGYRPTVVSGYSGGGYPLFAAIFAQTGGPPFEARNNLTTAEYQQTFNQLSAQGYQPTVISGYDGGGQPLFAAIFEQTGGPPFQSRVNLDSSQYQQFFSQMTSQGYQPTLVNGYACGGQVLFAATFAQNGGPPFEARNNLTTGQYQQTFDQLVSQGYRPAVISGYDGGGEPLFAAIFYRFAASNFQSRINLTSSDYQLLFNQMTAAGYQLTLVNGYVVNGQPLFAAIFEQ